MLLIISEAQGNEKDVKKLKPNEDDRTGKLLIFKIPKKNCHLYFVTLSKWLYE